QAARTDHLARVTAQLPHQDAEQRRFARAVGTGQTQATAVGKLERNVVQQGAGAERQRNAICFNHRGSTWKAEARVTSWARTPRARTMGGTGRRLRTIRGHLMGEGKVGTGDMMGDRERGRGWRPVRALRGGP